MCGVSGLPYYSAVRWSQALVWGFVCHAHGRTSEPQTSKLWRDVKDIHDIHDIEQWRVPLATHSGAPEQLKAAPIEPTSPAVSNVVFSLVRSSTASVETLIERNRCLNQAMGGNLNFDHVVFHDGNLSADAQGRMLDRTPGLRFADVTTYTEQPSDVGALFPENVDSDQSALGYRNMVTAANNFICPLQ